MVTYFKGVRQICDMMLEADNGKFVQIDVTAGRLHAQSVKCGNQYFIYLLNTTGQALTSVVSLTYTGNNKPSGKVFYPLGLKMWQMAHSKIVNGQISVPGFKLDAGQEAVLIIAAH